MLIVLTVWLVLKFKYAEEFVWSSNAVAATPKAVPKLSKL